MSGGAGPLVPTFHGFVQNSMDGLVLFEACLSGKLNHVPRRPHDRERSQLIKSGSVFIYEENASGIKRWTDGVAWSPSRILGNFLLYRELEKPFPPGEKKRAMKRKRTSIPGEPYPRRDSDDNEGDLPADLEPTTQEVPGEGAKAEGAGTTDHEKDLERSLIGSLVDSYGFRQNGLVKKTMSITLDGISHHMVSYYKVDDVKNNLLPRPGSDQRLQGLAVRPELYLKQNFRAPLEETEAFAIDGQMHAHPNVIYSPMGQGGYGVRPGTYFGPPQYAGMYSMPTSTGGPVYPAITGTSWQGQQSSAHASPYSHQQPYNPTPSYASSYSQPKSSEQSTPTSAKYESQPGSSQAMQYPGQYASSYPTMQRTGSQSTPMMPQSQYQTPVHNAPSNYGSMSSASGRASYGGNSMTSPTANGPSQQVYGSGAAQQPYAVRSPPQSYGVHSAPQSAVAQSPHTGLKSPQSAHPGTPSNDPSAQLHNPQGPYRSGSYAGQSGHSTADINGLGISSASSYSHPPHNGASYNYGAASQAFRPVGESSAQHGAPYAS